MFIHVVDAAYAISLVFGFMYVALWVFAKVLQTREDWDRDE